MASAINTQSEVLNTLLNGQKKNNSLEALLKAQLASQTVGETSGAGTTGSDDDFTASAQAIRAAAVSQQYQQSYAYSETMTLSLTTQEGDVVQVDFRQLYAQYQSYSKTAGVEEGPSGARYFESTEELEATAFEERFGFSVQGDLNEDELSAIFDVFKAVDSLADEFFNGDVEAAFQQAQALEVDFAQIKNFNLDLQKTETITTAYQETQAYQNTALPTQASDVAKQNLAELPQYLQKWQSVIEEMNQHFEDARARFDELMADTLAQRYDGEVDNPLLETDAKGWLDHIRSFHDAFAEAAGLDKQTLKPSGVEVTSIDYDPEAVLEDVKAQDTDASADNQTKQDLTES